MDAMKKKLVVSASTFPSRFLSTGIAMASSFGNHTVLPRRVMGFFDSLWDSLRFCFLVEKFPAFLRGGAWLNVMGILSSWLLWCINIDSWNTPCAIGCICYRKMGDVQQLPCLWTGLYHCFRCLTLYFLSLSTDPMCPPEQKDLFIGAAGSEYPLNPTNTSRNTYWSWRIIPRRKRFIKLALPVPPKITAQENNPQSETCSVKKHVKHVVVVSSEPHALPGGLEQKNSPSQHSVWAFRFNQFHKKWLVVIYGY